MSRTRIGLDALHRHSAALHDNGNRDRDLTSPVFSARRGVCDNGGGNGGGSSGGGNNGGRPEIPRDVTDDGYGTCNGKVVIVCLLLFVLICLFWEDWLALISSFATYCGSLKILTPGKTGERCGLTDPPIDQSLGKRVCKLEKKINKLSGRMDSIEETMKKLNEATEEGTLGKSPEKILDQIMDVEVGKVKDRPLTLRTLIATYMDVVNDGDGSDFFLHKHEERFLKLMDEKIEAFKYQIVICGPNVKEGVWCIPTDSNGNVDVGILKKELIVFIEDTIRKLVNRNPPPGDIGAIVSRAIAKYDADKTALPDLALEPGGGEIVNCRSTKYATCKKSSSITFLGLPVYSFASNTPRSIIQPGIVPGECFAFTGPGVILIKLIAPAYITGFTLEHMPKVNSPTGLIDSAPRNFEVIGYTDYNDEGTEFKFGEYQYLDNYVPLQTFTVQNKNDTTMFPYIELRINDNHGGDYTCVYRFRVHGSLNKSAAEEIENGSTMDGIFFSSDDGSKVGKDYDEECT